MIENELISNYAINQSSGMIALDLGGEDVTIALAPLLVLYSRLEAADASKSRY